MLSMNHGCVQWPRRWPWVRADLYRVFPREGYQTRAKGSGTMGWGL